LEIGILKEDWGATPTRPVERGNTDVPAMLLRIRRNDEPIFGSPAENGAVLPPFPGSSKKIALSESRKQRIITAMMLRILFSLLCSAAAFLILSCGPSNDLPLMAGNNQAAASEGEALYLQAKQADDAGDTKHAIKRYDQTASRYPFTNSASQARFRQAELLEQTGQTVKAFEAYQQFLTRFQASNLYASALARQAKIAQSAADGEVKKSFLGLHSKLDVKTITEMLGQVRDNAPKTPTAAKAQFTIGEIYQNKHSTKESALAIASYRQLVRDQPDCSEAPEALFRIGVVLTDEADRGNQNQATLDLAREAFNDYLTQYPNHSRNAEARKLIAGLGSRQLQRSFDIAEYYFKTGRTESAKVYYRDIAKRAQSGPLYDASRSRLKELGE
jgi:outer membrane protein assembly factor BamD (BamD/ComL family)